MALYDRTARSVRAEADEDDPRAGTTNGLIHLIGSPAFQCTLHLSLSPQVPAAAIKFLTFHPGQARIVCIDAKDTLHSWALGPGCMDDHKGLPMKEVTVSLYGDVTCVLAGGKGVFARLTRSARDLHYQLHRRPVACPFACEPQKEAFLQRAADEGLSRQLFMTMRDGNTLAYDLARRNLSPYKIPNVWQMHEDRLRRSGVPGRGFKVQAYVRVVSTRSSSSQPCFIVPWRRALQCIRGISISCSSVSMVSSADLSPHTR